MASQTAGGAPAQHTYHPQQSQSPKCTPSRHSVPQLLLHCDPSRPQSHSQVPPPPEFQFQSLQAQSQQPLPAFQALPTSQQEQHRPFQEPDDQLPPYPLIHLFDPYLNSKIDVDESHASLVTRQYGDCINSVQSTPTCDAPNHMIDPNNLHLSPFFMDTCEAFPEFDPQLVRIQFQNENLTGIDAIREDEGIDRENDDSNRVSYYNEDDTEDESTLSSIESDCNHLKSCTKAKAKTKTKTTIISNPKDNPTFNTSTNSHFNSNFSISDVNNGIITTDTSTNTNVNTLFTTNSTPFPNSFTIIDNNNVTKYHPNSNALKKPLRRISTPNLALQQPLVCNQKNCHKTFENKNDYKKHLRSHSSLTFQCPYHYSMPKHKGKHIFNRMDVWKRHLRTFHFEFKPGEDSNQGLGTCRVCGEFFEYFNVFADEHIECCAKRLKHQLKL